MRQATGRMPSWPPNKPHRVAPPPPPPHLPLQQVVLALRQAVAAAKQLLPGHGHAGAAVIELGAPILGQHLQAVALPPHRRRALASSPTPAHPEAPRGRRRGRPAAAGMPRGGGQLGAGAAAARRGGGRAQAAAQRRAAAGRLARRGALLRQQPRRCLRLRLRELLLLIPRVAPALAQPQAALRSRAVVHEGAQDVGAGQQRAQRV